MRLEKLDEVLDESWHMAHCRLSSDNRHHFIDFVLLHWFQELDSSARILYGGKKSQANTKNVIDADTMERGKGTQTVLVLHRIKAHVCDEPGREKHLERFELF